MSSASSHDQKQKFGGPTAHPIPALGNAQGHAPEWDSRAKGPTHAAADPLVDASYCGLMGSLFNPKPGSRNLASNIKDGSGFHGGDPEKEQ